MVPEMHNRIDPVRHGVDLPVFDTARGPETILAIAATAERLGFHSVSVSERLLLPLDAGWVEQFGLPDHHNFESLQTLTWVAAHTKRIRLMTGIVNSLFRSPVMLAQQLATLDHFSGGRVDAGIGLGWMPEEYAVSSVPLQHRGVRFEEHIAAMRACWAPDPVEHHGRFYDIPRANIGPKPFRGTIPLFIGGLAQPAVERAARLGAGFITAVRDWETSRTEIDIYRAAGGNGPVVVRAMPVVDTSADPAQRIARTVQGMMDALVRFATAGVDDIHWCFNVAGTEPDEQMTLLEAFAQNAGLHPSGPAA
jgi:probable F420-dependent oxidoreductase